ncbi:MAG: hypothetical protein WC455_19240 [Dehalococcoidia bacterium]|jgi:hypothetical protein
MKINSDVRISINSGAALCLFVLAFFGLLILASVVPTAEKLFIPALTGLLSAFGGFLVKRNANNKLATEEKVEALKVQAPKGKCDV